MSLGGRGTRELSDAQALKALPVWARLTADEFWATHDLSAGSSALRLHRILARELLPVLGCVPHDDDLGVKPLVLRLSLPLPPRLRFYVYRATQHDSERQAGAYRVQLTVGDEVSDDPRRYRFSREDNIRPILLGFEPRLRVFVVWDADVHDARKGFPYSKGVQAPPDVVYGAAANGIATATRNVRSVNRNETIVAARTSYLIDALLKRIATSNYAITPSSSC